MNYLVHIVLLIFIVLFTLTGIFSILSIVHFGKIKRPLVTIQDKYRTKLFHSLILEVIAVIISLAVIFIGKINNGIRNIDKITEWRVTADEWTLLSQSWINEPSGLCNSGLLGVDSRGGQFALAVDDDEADIFVIGSMFDNLGVMKALPFRAERPNDLEAICWDGDEWYYAITSHRRLGNGQAKTRKLLRFRIDPKLWLDPAYEIEADSKDISKTLYEYLITNGIIIDTVLWDKKSEPQAQWHPYALEIEGLSYINGDLIIGLKWPLDETENALLFRYNWEAGEFRGILRIALNGKGISALTFDPSKNILIVAANPPEKEREDNKEDYSLYLGESVGYVFKWINEKSELEFSHKLASVSHPNTRLEGIALLAGNEVWLAYDGPIWGLFKKSADEIELYSGNN